MSTMLSPLRNLGWRENYNPLRGLTLAKVLALQEAGERGDYPDLQWLYRAIERSDEVIGTVITRRTAALLSLDWEIRVPQDLPRESQALAEDQAALLRHVYGAIDNFEDAVKFLSTAHFRGYAHLEKHYDAGDKGLIAHLEPVEQWFWKRKGMLGPWKYLPDATLSIARGIDIDPADFIVFETAPLNRPLSVLYFRKALAIKNWDSYLEVYGIPSTFFIGPPGTSTEKEAEYLRMAEELLADGRGYLPNGADVKYITGGTGRPPFKELIEYLDQQIVLAATGGYLNMLAQPNTGMLAAGPHQDSFRQIAAADAALIAEVFQKHIDRPLLELYFPGRPPLAYFAYDRPPEDLSSLVNNVLLLSSMGYQVDPGQLSEKIGLRVTRMAPAPAGV